MDNTAVFAAARESLTVRFRRASMSGMITLANLAPLLCRCVRRLLMATTVASLVLPATGASGGLLRFRDLVSSATVKLAPADGPPTTEVRVRGSGFGAGEPVDLFFDTTSVGVATANASGAFSGAVITVPARATPGVHWVIGRGERTQLAAQAPFRVHTDWPSFHNGPEHTGLNIYEKALSPRKVAGLELDWSTNIHGNWIISSPSVADGVVYAGSSDSNLYAVDASSGTTLWANSGAGHDSHMSWSTPTVADGVVYIGDGVYLDAFRTHGGRRLWSAATGKTIYSSPTVANAVVYIGSSDGKLYAFNAASGAALWSATIGPSCCVSAWSSPAVANGVVYIGGTDSYLHAFDAATGAVLWTADTSRPVQSSPAVANGVVYVGSDAGNLYAFNAHSGALLWQTAISGYEGRSSPAVANGVVYVGWNDMNLYAINAASGAVLWQHRLSGQIITSPAVANGVVYASSQGNLYAFGADKGRRLWNESVGPFPDWDVSSPAIADGVVYVGSFDGKLNAYHLSAP